MSEKPRSTGYYTEPAPSTKTEGSPLMAGNTTLTMGPPPADVVKVRKPVPDSINYKEEVDTRWDAIGEPQEPGAGTNEYASEQVVPESSYATKEDLMEIWENLGSIQNALSSVFERIAKYNIGASHKL